MPIKQTILPSGKITIFVDTREGPSSIVNHLKEKDATIVEKLLDVGDYICSDRVGIERKTIKDFLQSIIDQRIFKQMEKLIDAFEKPILLLEGSPEMLFLERNIHENAIRGVLSSIVIDYRIPILWTSNTKETAAQVYWMAKREQEKEKREVQIRSLKKNNGITQMQEFLVCGLPSVSTKLGRRLLNEFKTPKNIFAATEEELVKIDKIGKEKAKKILSVLEKEYKKD